MPHHYAHNSKPLECAMNTPYAAKAPRSFWKLAVAERSLSEIDPIPAKRFQFGDADRVATAGSCFAQHVSAHIKARGRVRFLQTEDIAPGQPPFSALYGNVYTARQLAQLASEACGERRPADLAWLRPDGRYVDALRPSVFADGFADIATLHEARQAHLAAVRSLLVGCTVFVFTLGLTEAWVSRCDGTAFPLAPGVLAQPQTRDACVFRNFTYEDVCADLDDFIARIENINPGVRIILTVSPVPLTATYTEEHVLVATSHSKAILRAVCGAMVSKHERVHYFPSYEMIAGHHTRGEYFADNLRTVKDDGVAHVMRVFDETYGVESGCAASATETGGTVSPASRLFSRDDGDVLCDEAEIVKTLGF
jgi:hypothetical protein